MINSKLFQILRTFSKKEFKDFEKFILSPFFSKGRDLIPLYRVLKRFYPDFSNDNLTYKNIFPDIHGDKKYNYVLINKMFSEMIKASEEYLMQIAFKKDYMDSRRLLLGELIARKIDSRYKIHMKATEKHLHSQKLRPGYFADRATLEIKKFNFNYTKDKQELVTENVVKRSEYNLMQFLITAGLDLHDLKVNNRAFNSPFDETLLNKFVSSIDVDSFLENILPGNFEFVQFFALKLAVSLKTDIKYFNSFKNFFYENIDRFDREYKKYVCTSLEAALNELTTVKDELTMRRELFELVKLILKHHIYESEDEKSFPFIPYKSFINYAIYLKEYEWVENFIEKYCPRLQKEYVENMYHYSYAFLYRAKGENEKSLDECSKVEFENIILNYDIKLIILMNYYELGEMETALSFVDSLSHFLKSNKKISQSYILYFGNFVKSVKKLILYKDDHSKLLSLKFDIENEKVMYGKNWLLSKINNFKF